MGTICVYVCFFQKNGSNETKQKPRKKEKQQKIQSYTLPHSNTCRACPFRMHFVSTLFDHALTLSVSVKAESENNRLVSRSLLIFPEQKTNRMNKCSIAAYIRNSFFILLSISFLLCLLLSRFIFYFLLLPIVFHQFHVSHINLSWLQFEIENKTVKFMIFSRAYTHSLSFSS